MTDKPFLTWHDRDQFELGAIYVSRDSDATLEYVGCVIADVARRLVPLAETVDEPDDFAAVLLFREVTLPGGYDGRDGDGTKPGLPGHKPADMPMTLWTHTRADHDRGEVFEPLAQRLIDEPD